MMLSSCWKPPFSYTGHCDTDRYLVFSNGPLFQSNHSDQWRLNDGGRISSQPITIIWGHFGLIQGSLNNQVIGQWNVTVVSEDVVVSYACGWHSTSQLRGRGGIGLTGPLWLVWGCWIYYQWENYGRDKPLPLLVIKV